MPERVVHLDIQVDLADGFDPREVARLRSELRGEILGLGVLEVSSLAPQRTSATKSSDAIAAGALAVSLIASMVPALVAAIQAWAASWGSRRVRLELDGDVLEVTGISSAEQDRLVEAWLERSPRPGAG